MALLGVRSCPTIQDLVDTVQARGLAKRPAITATRGEAATWKVSFKHCSGREWFNCDAFCGELAGVSIHFPFLWRHVSSSQRNQVSVLRKLFCGAGKRGIHLLSGLRMPRPELA